jgi:ribosome-associated protein
MLDMFQDIFLRYLSGFISRFFHHPRDDSSGTLHPLFSPSAVETYIDCHHLYQTEEIFTLKPDQKLGTGVACAKRRLIRKRMILSSLKGAHTSVADYFVICTGRSDIQVQTICRAVEEAMAKIKVRSLAIEGFTHGQWVLVDFGDVVVHIFYETARDFYNLERLWSQASRCALPEPYSSQAQHLRIVNA